MRVNLVTPMTSHPAVCAMASISSTPGINGKPGKWPSKMVDVVGTRASVRMVCSARLRSTMRSMSWKYSSRMRASGALGGDELVDAGAQIVQLEVLLGRRLAVVDFLRPLLERHLDSERLVDRKGDVEEVQAVDAEIVDRVAFRLDRLARNVAGLRDDIGHGIKSRRHP